MTPWAAAPPPRTNHLLHLVLSVLTAGLWVPVWIIVTLSNDRAQARYWEQVNAGWISRP